MMESMQQVAPRQYLRADKPPFSYVGLTAMAIQSSATKRLRLFQIYERILEMFPLLKLSNAAWRDSVRHNLPKYDCFYVNNAENIQLGKPGKGNFWSVIVSKIPEMHLKQQSRAVCRPLPLGVRFVDDLTEVFDFHTGTFVVSGKTTAITGIEPLLLIRAEAEPMYNRKKNLMSPVAVQFAGRKRKQMTELDDQILPKRRQFDYNTFISTFDAPWADEPNSCNILLKSADKLSPPFPIGGLTCLAYLSLGVEITTPEVITCHLKEIFPFWKQFPKAIELLVNQALKSNPEIFVPIKSIHQTFYVLQFHMIRSTSPLMEQKISNNFFVRNLYQTLQEYKYALKTMSSQQIRRMLINSSPKQPSLTKSLPHISLPRTDSRFSLSSSCMSCHSI